MNEASRLHISDILDWTHRASRKLKPFSSRQIVSLVFVIKSEQSKLAATEPPVVDDAQAAKLARAAATEVDRIIGHQREVALDHELNEPPVLVPAKPRSRTQVDSLCPASTAI